MKIALGAKLSTMESENWRILKSREKIGSSVSSGESIVERYPYVKYTREEDE